ncbi:hypothetical protein GCM10009716_08890 [Streptomyces sodiiphilus]|uniref:DUF1540 domain-containing protein n=1 Tax=Streptomyces sodiiphilus TaxID=226217 RepID=A0ABP5A4V2_9ACTN
MDMPDVTECAAEPCAYNSAGSCQALAITVGDSRHAHCDTFFTTSMSGGDPSGGRVGACKMAGCRHNVNLECQASGISVGLPAGQAECMTYAPA